MVYFIVAVDFDKRRVDKRYLEYIEKVVPIVKKYPGRYIKNRTITRK